jgi:polysaccharide pyruvyl transferase CsaB
VSTHLLICGYYGHSNVGDEAILDVLLGDISRTFTDPHVTVVSDLPNQIRKERGLDAIDLRDIESVIGAAAQSDLMVLGGGGLFQDLWRAAHDTLLLPSHWGLSYYAGFAILGALVGTPVAIYGAGAGPLDTEDGRTLTAAAFESATLATVRNRASLDLLTDIGVPEDRVTLTADPAFRLEPANRAEPRSGTIGVSVRPWGDGEWMESLAQGLDDITELLDTDIEFLPFQNSELDHENDAAIAAAVAGQMRHKERTRILQPAPTAAEMAGRFFGYDLVIGMRLHSVVFAMAASVPVIAVAYRPKVRNLMTDAGLGEYVVELDEAAALPALAERARRDRDSIITHLNAIVPQFQERAEGNKTVLSATRRHTALGTVTRDLLCERVRLWRTVSELGADLDRTREELDQTKATYDALLHSRALAPARLYWKLRGRS